MKFKIAPREIDITIEADNAEEAMAIFAAEMDLDMNIYFSATKSLTDQVPVKQVNLLNVDGVISVSTEECEELLIGEDGDFVSEEAKAIDENIGYYVPSDIFEKSDEQIINYIRKYIDDEIDPEPKKVNVNDFKLDGYGSESTGYVYATFLCKKNKKNYYYQTSTKGYKNLQLEICFDPKSGKIDYVSYMALDAEDDILEEFDLFLESCKETSVGLDPEWKIEGIKALLSKIEEYKDAIDKIHLM